VVASPDPNDLGALRATARPRPVARIAALTLSSVALLFSATVLAGLGYFIIENNANDTASLVIEDVIYLAIGAIVFAYAMRLAPALMGWWPNPTVSLFERGLVYERGGERKVIAWDSLDRLVFRGVRVVIFTPLGDKTGETYRVTLGAGPVSFVVTESIAFTPDILALARRAIVENTLAGALERVRKGETVSFGRESVGPEHMLLSGRTLPWTRVRTIDTRDGLVIVTQSGRPARTSQWIRKIPNVDVFVALCQAQNRAH